MCMGWVRWKKQFDCTRCVHLFLIAVPTGLLALQGEDETGIFLRRGLQQLAVSTEFLRVDKSYKTGEVGLV